MPRAKGIDVSHYHPVLSWPDVASAGIAFMGIKATEGNNTVDPKLRSHIAGFRSQPFVLGMYYHFARSGDPIKQAQRLLDATGELRPNERLALDLEVLPDTAANTLAWVDAFFAELPAVPRPIIYTSARIWKMFGNPDWERASGVDLWAPRYSSDEPALPMPWTAWTFWQWTDGGAEGAPYSCPGVGACDADVFNGTEDELREYATSS